MLGGAVMNADLSPLVSRVHALFDAVARGLDGPGEVPVEVLETLAALDQPQPMGDAVSAPQNWAWNYTYLPPLAYLDRVPLRQEFELRWLFMVGVRLLEILVNQVAA